MLLRRRKHSTSWCSINR